MDTVQAAALVIDRLEEWFGSIPRETVARILREEMDRYQRALLLGEVGPPAEHRAYERLSALHEAQWDAA